MALKLRQGQIWKHGNEYIRIVHLERLEVAYKVLQNLHTTKKDFCRLLKECRLLELKVESLPEDEPDQSA
jgi:hypothetical protein